ncbi:uncharacterized protein LOC9649731 [Selaginella moellendorffii]|uniref:uncharacterized protein LOC9649731 n=1 Tax=Selaginella moellendorffii TaxID=88036 RepID=UPI000D1C374C|nr:uncharacterized protein LOC9649731 [Selaginella moellendorffii]|eukprot:XP_024537349.1 uncharacterized protein LOC9649731 [Selaginella moellendorffii]
MEQGLLSPNGEYDLADIYKDWNLGRNWIMWRQFLMNHLCHGFTAYGFYMATIHWPPQRSEEVSATIATFAFIGAGFFSALMYIFFGRKKTITYGFLVGGISGVCSLITTNQWVMLLLLAISCCGLFTPFMQPIPDDWYDGVGVFASIVISIVWMLVYVGSYSLALAAPPLAWQVQALVLVGSIFYAGLLHRYMLQSPREPLWGYCVGFPAMDLEEVDVHKQLAVMQDKAIQALRVFAEATGNALPKNLRSLKKPPHINSYLRRYG